MIESHLKGDRTDDITACPAVTENVLSRLQLALDTGAAGRLSRKIERGRMSRDTQSTGDEHPSPDGEEEGRGDGCTDSAGPSNAVPAC